MQSLFQRSAGLNLRLVLFCVLSISIMTIDHRFSHLQSARAFLREIIYPVEFLVSLPSSLMDATVRLVSTHNMLRSRITVLEDENLQLKFTQQRMGMLDIENQRLRQLLHSSDKIKHRVLIAELLSVDQDPFRQQVRLNKGKSSGVYIGQPIIDATGIMGQIIEVSNSSSTALLISDPSHAIPVELARNGLRSIAEGSGKADQIGLLYLPHNADIRIGDQVITSGLGGVFPRGYPVAVVYDIQYPETTSFAAIFARPTALLDRSREVLLIAVKNNLPAQTPPEAPQAELEAID